MKNARIATVPALFLALAALSCAHRAPQALDPRPNIDLPSSPRTLRVAISPDVPDEFKTRGGGTRAIKVRLWRTALENGFRNAFSEFFKVVPPDAPADLTLEIAETDLRPAMVTSQAARAVLRYKARLLDGSGQVLMRQAGEASSRGVVYQAWDFWQVEREAIESMYEEIAAKFFGANSGVPEPVAPQAKPANDPI